MAVISISNLLFGGDSENYYVPGIYARLFIDLCKEVDRARSKFPANKHLNVALQEEVGELAEAQLKGDKDRIRKEAIQVIATVIRIIEEGDKDLEERLQGGEAVDLGFDWGRPMKSQIVNEDDVTGKDFAKGGIVDSANALHYTNNPASDNYAYKSVVDMDAFAKGEIEEKPNLWAMGHNVGKAEGYEEGYGKGYRSGKKEGSDSGFRRGREIGVQYGREEGEKAGYERGFSEAQKSNLGMASTGEMLMEIRIRLDVSGYPGAARNFIYPLEQWLYNNGLYNYRTHDPHAEADMKVDPVNESEQGTARPTEPKYEVWELSQSGWYGWYLVMRNKEEIARFSIREDAERFIGIMQPTKSV